MADKARTQKDPNRTGTMSAERFIAKLRKRDATKDERLEDYLTACEARFNRREYAWRCDQLTEVIEAERPPAVAMARALGLAIDDPNIPPGFRAESHIADVQPSDPAVDDPPVQPQGEQVPEPTPRGVTDYVPGPVAQAARRGR